MNTINPTRQLVLICLFLILATFEGQTRTLAFWSFNSAPDTSWPEQIEDDSGSVLLTHSFTKTQSYDGTTINASEGMEAGQSFCPQGGTKTENNGAWFAISVPQIESGTLTLSYAVRRTGTGFSTHQIEYSCNGGVDWTFLRLIDISEWANSWKAEQIVIAEFRDLDEMYNNPGFLIRVVLDGATNSNGNNRIDNLKLELNKPDLVIEGQLYDFTQVEKNSISDLQFYYLNAEGLEDDVIVVAPDGFEISVDCSSGFSASLSLHSSECRKLRIYVRFVPSNTGEHKGWIVHNCGTTNAVIEVKGTGVEPSDYDYDVSGRGMVLLFSLHRKINVNKPLSEDQLWNFMADSDLRFDGSIWDIFSSGKCKEPAYVFDPITDCGRSKECSKEGEGYGMFQTWPLTRYVGADADTVFSDAHLVFPGDMFVASRCTRLSPGLADVCEWTSVNGCRIGTMRVDGTLDINVFEPVDEYKGDIARAWFYALTRYIHRIPVWCQLDLLPESFDCTSILCLNKAVLGQLMRWHRDDPVSQKEILRNKSIGLLQGNSNPFVDQPDLAYAVFSELTWTDEIDVSPNGSGFSISGDWLYLENDVLQPFSYEIFDTMGRLIKAGHVKGDRIFTGGLTGGIYVVCIRLDGERQCIKLVK